MHLESQKVTTGKSQQELYAFLIRVENYEQLMPENTEKFEVRSPETFAFALKGMPEIELRIQETRAPELVVLGSTSDSLDFSLEVRIAPEGQEQSQAQLIFDGKFNAMMSMMVKSPLKKFIHTLSENLEKL